MSKSSTPIRRTLMNMIFLSSGVVLLVTSSAFCAYEFLTFRSIQHSATADFEPGHRQQQHGGAGVRKRGRCRERADRFQIGSAHRGCRAL